MRVIITAQFHADLNPGDWEEEYREEFQIDEEDLVDMGELEDFSMRSLAYSLKSGDSSFDDETCDDVTVVAA